MAKTVYMKMRLPCTSFQTVELSDASIGIVCQVDDAVIPMIAGDLEYIEGETDWKDCPAEWKMPDDSPRLAYFGHDPTAPLLDPDPDLEPDPEPIRL